MTPTLLQIDLRGLQWSEGASLSVDIAAGRAVADAIQAKTDNLPANPADVSDVPTASQIEAALINEGDGQQLIDAILTVINNSLDVPALELAAIASAVRGGLAMELGRLDSAVSSRLAAAGYVALDNAGISTAATETAAASTAASALQSVVSGISRLGSWLGLLAGKAADAVTLSELQATTGVAGYDNTTDSLQAVRDRGDAEWTRGGSGGATPFLNRKPNRIIDVSSKADGYLTQGRVRIVRGATLLVALAYPDPDDWLSGMDLPVSPNTDELTIDGEAYGVNRNWAMVEVTCSETAAVGGEVSLPVVVQPEVGLSDPRKILFEVINPSQ